MDLLEFNAAKLATELPAIPKDKRLHHIVWVVSRECGCKEDKVFSRERASDVAYVRQLCMVLAYQSGMTLTYTGRAFDRDHAAVCSAIKSVKDKISVYPEERDRYDRLCALLQIPVSSRMPVWMPK